MTLDAKIPYPGDLNEIERAVWAAAFVHFCTLCKSSNDAVIGANEMIKELKELRNMGSPKWFPILRDAYYRRRLDTSDVGYIDKLPWALVAPFEKRAQLNHDQTLEVLAQRGGLDPIELWHIVHDKPLFKGHAPPLDACEAWLCTFAREATP